MQQADDLTASAASGWAQQAGLAQLDEVRPGPRHLAAVEDGGDREGCRGQGGSQGAVKALESDAGQDEGGK